MTIGPDSFLGSGNGVEDNGAVTSGALVVFRQPGGTPPINRLKSLTPLAYLPSWRGLDRRRLGPRRAMILNAGSNR
jgi:hypothetical protein